MPGESNIGQKMNEITAHWDEIHTSKDRDVSWWQENLWLDFLAQVPVIGGAIDVGAGQSPIAIELAKLGFEPVFINDLASSALKKLTDKAKSIEITLKPIIGNLLEIDLPTPVSLWHDRAVFHFLTEAADIQKYKSVLISNTLPEAFVVISTFSENGPDQCSGLNVSKYSGEDLAQIFAPDFRAIHTEKRVHVTPWKSEQEFTIAILQKS